MSNLYLLLCQHSKNASCNSVYIVDTIEPSPEKANELVREEFGESWWVFKIVHIPRTVLILSNGERLK